VSFQAVKRWPQEAATTIPTKVTASSTILCSVSRNVSALDQFRGPLVQFRRKVK